MKAHSNMPERAQNILYAFLFCFVLIGMRIWYLAILKHEEYQTLARKPQVRITVEEPPRGTIRDRFNIPLAVNKIEYVATLCYEPIRRLPTITWKKNESGKKTKYFFRKTYITNLIAFLAKELDLSPRDVEDMIYSKAALFPNMPILLKEGLSEETYYRLHAREKDWPGLTLQLRPKRHYPKGMVASSVLGYMGMIQEKHLDAVKAELLMLEQYLKDKSLGIPTPLPKGYLSTSLVKKRFQELKEKSYTIRSLVGKAGIEGKFDDQLRGVPGKKKVEIDSKGRALRNLPDSSPSLSGRRILLTLSSELQEYAEELLALNEVSRHIRFPSAGKNHQLIASPWIKGGAIVAILPKTGEVVTLASYPRYAPKDFVERERAQTSKWLETPAYIGEIWDGIRPLERELRGKTLLPRAQFLTLDLYLDTVLTLKSPVRSLLDSIATVKEAVLFLKEVDFLWALSKEKKIHPLIDTLFPEAKGHTPTFYKTSQEKRAEILENLPKEHALSLLSSISHNDDKILFLDLLRLIVPHHLFTEALLKEPLEESFATYRRQAQIASTIRHTLRSELKKEFHEKEFQEWRKIYFDSYLKEKRKEEKEEGRYQRPYLTYLESQEESLFEIFFREREWECLLERLATSKEGETLYQYLAMMDKSTAMDYLKTLRSFQDLNRPLLGKYYFPFGGGKEAEEISLARHFYPFPGFGYAKSFAYQETAPLGSIFKLVTGYEATKQHFLQETSLNPLVLVDQSPSYQEKISASTILGYTASGLPITRIYKGGRLPRGHPNIGKIDLPSALERSSNLYFALLAMDRIKHPNDLVNTAYKLGLGHRTGIDLIGEAKGHLPSDLWCNPTALYAFSIGQHSLTTTPLQTALLISAFANQGKVIKPQIVHTIANLEPKEERDAFFNKSSFSYQDLLSNIGVYFPLFPIPEDQEKTTYLWKSHEEVLDELYLPDEMRHFLFDGLSEVVHGQKGTARPEVIRSLREAPHLRRLYEEISPYFIGKTSTAEIVYRPFLERDFTPIIAKNIWFAGISFHEPNAYDDPELIVVVFLRYADHGKEAAPLAAQIIKKWREIKERHE